MRSHTYVHMIARPANCVFGRGCWVISILWTACIPLISVFRAPELKLEHFMGSRDPSRSGLSSSSRMYTCKTFDAIKWVAQYPHWRSSAEMCAAWTGGEEGSGCPRNTRSRNGAFFCPKIKRDKIEFFFCSLSRSFLYIPCARSKK